MSDEENPTTYHFALLKNVANGLGTVAFVQRARSAAMFHGLGIEWAIQITEGDPLPAIGETYHFAGNHFGDPPPPENVPPTLEELKASRRALVNASCDQYRGECITKIAGQETIYQWKLREANAIDAMLAATQDPFSEANRTQFPVLLGEANATQQSLETVYTQVKEALGKWTTAGMQTEIKRRGLLTQIDGAGSADALPSLNIDWATPW